MSDKSKIPAHILDLSKKALGGISLTLNGETAEAKFEGNVVFDNLPEGQTKEAIEQAFAHVHSCIGGVTHAFGEKCNEAAIANKDLKTVTLEVPLVGKDTWSVTYHRSKTFPVPGGTEVTRYGVLEGKLETYEARGKVGVLKNVREEIGAAALAAFGAK